MLNKDWEAWRRIARSPDLGTIDLVYERMKTKEAVRGKFDVYYIVFELERYEERFLFLLGLDEDMELNGEFISDSPGTANLQSQRYWAKEMLKLVPTIVTGYRGDLARVLTAAVKLYARIRANPEEYIEPLAPIRVSNPYIDLHFLSAIRSNPRMKVRPINNSNWEAMVHTEDAIIDVVLYVYTSPSHYCILRVISPRMAIGRNINFGGFVVGPGLMKSSPSKDLPSLINAIVAVLDDEVPMLNYGYEYTDEEYNASKFKSKVDEIPVPQHRSKLVIYPTDLLRDSSMVMIDMYLFTELIQEREILWLKLKNLKMEKEMWVMCQPSHMDRMIRSNEIYVSDVVLANLDCDPGDEVSISTGYLPTVDSSGVEIRLRGQNSDIEEVRTYIEEMSSLCVGSTYSCPSSNSKGVAYFDVMKSGIGGACSLRLIRADIKITTQDALIPTYVPREEEDPLAIDHDSSVEEESD